MAAGDGNLLPAILDAVRAYATVGEISDRLRVAWGEHRELSQNLIASGRGDLVKRSITDQLFRGLFDSFRETPPTSRNPNPSNK